MADILSQIFNTGNGTPMKGGTPVATPVQQQAALVQQTQQTQQQTQQQQQQQEEPSPTSHLDGFASLWQTPITDDGKPAPIPADPLSQPVFTLDKQKIVESASKMNFAGDINPELAQKALSGDVNALADIINGAVRNAVVGVTLSQGELLNNAMLANNQRITQALPTAINRTTLLNSQTDDPVLSHPAVQPLITALKQTAFAKNPTANPAEIEAQIHNYVRGLSKAVVDTSPENIKKQQQEKANEPDWMAALGIPTSPSR